MKQSNMLVRWIAIKMTTGVQDFEFACCWKCFEMDMELLGYLDFIIKIFFKARRVGNLTILSLLV